MPYKDPEKAREYNRKKKLEYYYKNKELFNKRRLKYKKSIVTKEKQKEYSDRYYLKNCEKVIQRSRNYRKNNKVKVNEGQRNRNRRNDPTIRLGDLLREYVRGAIEFKDYVERVRQFIDESDEKIS